MARPMAEFWALLEMLEKPEARRVVFYDPNQNIFRQDGSGEAAIPIDGPPVTLDQNCRSTARINQAACRAGEVPHPSRDGPVQGEAPVIHEAGHPLKVHKALEEVIRECVEGGVKTRDMVILCPRKREHSSLSEVDALGRYRVVEEEPKGDREIRFATLQSFKGLEADVVLLVDVDLDHKSCSPESLYVGFSRACHRLHVWAPKEQTDRVRVLVGHGGAEASGRLD